MSAPRVALASDAWNLPEFEYAGTHIVTKAMLDAARVAGVYAYPLQRRSYYHRRIGGTLGPLAYQMLSTYPTYDVVHEATPFASRGADVVSIHDTIPFFCPNSADVFFRWKVTYSLRRAKRVIVTTDWMGDEIAKRFPWARPKLRTISYPFEIPTLQRATVTPFDALWVGRLAPNKNPLLYFKLADAFPEKFFVLRGPPSSRHPAYGRQVRAACPANVITLPLLSTGDRNMLYECVPIIVSTSGHEGFHLPIMEGYLRGMKVVLPYQRPYTEIYRNDAGQWADNTYWYAPDDAESLIGAFYRAQETTARPPDPDIVKRVSHDTVGKQLRTLYEEVSRR